MKVNFVKASRFQKVYWQCSSLYQLCLRKLRRSQSSLPSWPKNFQSFSLTVAVGGGGEEFTALLPSIEQ